MAVDEAAVRAAPRDGLPEILGELARLTALATMRLSARDQPEPADPLLTAAEVAKRLRVPRSALYKTRAFLQCRVELTPGRVRFSEKKLNAYIERRSR